MNQKSIEARVEKVRQLMKDKDVPALMITQLNNLRYLSGYTGDAGFLLITPDQAILSTDSRFWEQAEKQAPSFQIHQGKGRIAEWLASALEFAKNPKRVGIEIDQVTVSRFDLMQKEFPAVEWLKTGGIVEQVRAVKDADELVSMRKAMKLAEEGFDYLMTRIKPGMTEYEAAWVLEVYLREHGSEGLGFDSIIASGPNGSMAHHEPGDRVIQANEPIIIDWGARVDGYRSDNTRTIVLGESDAKFHEVYNTVKRAEENAIQNIKAGLTGKEGDALARDILTAAGYELGHGIGHGVGLAIHEEPRLSHLSEEKLPAGSVVTIEPAIYIPGWGGVRIEDMVLLKEDGAELLTHVGHK